MDSHSSFTNFSSSKQPNVVVNKRTTNKENAFAGYALNENTLDEYNMRHSILKESNHSIVNIRETKQTRMKRQNMCGNSSLITITTMQNTNTTEYTNEMEVQSDFSRIIDRHEFNFSDLLNDQPLDYQNAQTDASISRTESEIFSACKNETFNISSPFASDSLNLNNTYELSRTPTKNSTMLLSPHVPQNFGYLSPVPRSHQTFVSYALNKTSSPIMNNPTVRRQISTVEELDEGDWIASNYETEKKVDNFARCFRDRSDIDERSNNTRTLSVPKQQNTALCFDISPPSKKHLQLPPVKLPVRKRTGVCIEISPPKRACVRQNAPIRRVSPIKKGRIEKHDSTTIKKINRPSIRKTNVPTSRISNLSLGELSKKKDQIKTHSQQSKEASISVSNTHSFIKAGTSQTPITTLSADPFLASTLYYDSNWLCDQEVTFKKWLNELLSPPEDLNPDIETKSVDVAKVWQSCKHKADTILAETKDAVSARYHTNVRLNTLRKAACAMLRRPEVAHVFTRVNICVEQGTFTIRSDRDLHRDIGLQKEVLELFLSYNPLWLRIGLETTYNEIIPLRSNNDLIGLMRFLLARFFTDPCLAKKYAHAYHRSKQLLTFMTLMNKFMLKRFLHLIYFLDYAKTNKLIGHDPCLFHKKAKYKDSRAIILAFSRELLSGIGDVTKVLKGYDYVVRHKQTYVEEFDYAVNNLSVDLRDGVRLCRVMELITGAKDLTSKCRVPAISRLQKIYNVDAALKALSGNGFQIEGNIDAKAIVDGHREKTLSLLWQIVYKYQAPRFKKAAEVIQRFWRSKLWFIWIKRYVQRRRNDAARVIQRAYRRHLEKRKQDLLRIERLNTLKQQQSAVRFLQARWRFLKIISSVKTLQRWWRRTRETKSFVRRIEKEKQLIIFVQRKWKAKLYTRRQRNEFLQLKRAADIVQKQFRHIRKMRLQRLEYQRTRNTIIFVQRKWRSLKLMKNHRTQYKLCYYSACVIQRWWRRVLLVKKQRNEFLILKDSVKVIERWWKAIEDRKKFLSIRQSAVIIQRTWRKYKMQVNIRNYQAAVTIQKNWRTKKARQEYLTKRKSCIQIQCWWRMIRAKIDYQNRRTAVMILQKRYRALKIGRQARQDYSETRDAVICLQNYWRAILIGRQVRKEYRRLKMAVTYVESRWRALKLGREARYNYVIMRKATICLQSYWRATILGRKERERFIRLKASTVYVQRRWRALKLGHEARSDYMRKRSAAICIQRYRRAMLIGRRERNKFIELRVAAVYIQQRWKALRVGRKVRNNYLQMRAAVIRLQQYWRGVLIGRKERAQYIRLKLATLNIQRRWRALKYSQEVRADYVKKKEAAICLQTRWRAILLRRRQQKQFNNLKAASISIQRKWRANRICKETRKEYGALKKMTVYIQTQWRAKQRVKRLRSERYIQNESAKTIQKWWRHKSHERRYTNNAPSAVKIQRWWRALLNKRTQIIAVSIIENWWLGILNSRRNRAATVIQAVWRGYKVRKIRHAELSDLRKRCEAAKRAAVPTATLAYRCKESIDMFINCNCSIGQLSVCLISLDTVTRLLPKHCVTLCELNLVDRIYNIFDQCNRSLPWMTVCLQAASILITLVKFERTKHYVLKVEHATTVLRLLIASLDYTDLFLHLATLKWLLLQDKEYRETVLKCPQTVYLIKSVRTKISKKKSKVTTSKSRNQDHLLPSRTPDWGLKQKNPRVFTDIHYAVSAILKLIDMQ